MIDMCGYDVVTNIGRTFHTKFPKMYVTDWSGFNMCMCPVPYQNMKDVYLCTLRKVLTPQMLTQSFKQWRPGTRASSFVRNLPHMRPQDFDDSFFWNGWHQSSDTTVVFLAQYAPGGKSVFRPFTRPTPFFISGKKSRFQKPPCVYSERTRKLDIPDFMIQRMNVLEASDFRITGTYPNVILHDAYVTSIHAVVITPTRILLKPYVERVCGLPVTEPAAVNGGRKTYENRLTANAPYYNYFAKNWTFVSENKNKLLFLDWFYESGVHGIVIDKTTGKCTRKILVHIRGDALPRVPDARFPGFSFGSTVTHLSSDATDVIGVGHVKFAWRHISRDNNARLYRRMHAIDRIFSETFKRRYIRHAEYAYASFFFRLTTSHKRRQNGGHRMRMSDLWVPCLPQDTTRFQSLVFFPMSITPSEAQSTLLVSGGMSDFYNVIIHLNKQSVLDACVHDLSDCDLGSIDVSIMHPDNLSLHAHEETRVQTQTFAKR